MNLDIIKDKVSGVWRSLTKEELEEHVEGGGESWRPNRAAIRYYKRTLRRKGPGYTRAMRDGREQRVVEGLLLIGHQPAKTERDRYGRGPRRRPHRLPRRRHR